MFNNKNKKIIVIIVLSPEDLDSMRGILLEDLDSMQRILCEDSFNESKDYIFQLEKYCSPMEEPVLLLSKEKAQKFYHPDSGHSFMKTDIPKVRSSKWRVSRHR